MKKRLKTAAAVAGVCGIILVVLFLYLYGVACPSKTVIVINNAEQDAELVRLEGWMKNWQWKLPNGRARQVTIAPGGMNLVIAVTLDDGQRFEYPPEQLAEVYESSVTVFVIKKDHLERADFRYTILDGYDAGSFPDRVLSGLKDFFRAINCTIMTIAS